MAWESASGVTPSAAARVSACRRVSRPINIWSSSIRIALDSLTVVRSFLFMPLPVRRRRRRGSLIASGAALLWVLGRLRPPSRVPNVLPHRLCGRRAIPLTQRDQNRLVLVRGLPPRGLSGRAGQETCTGQRPQAVHQRGDEGIPGCLVDDLVEGEIGSEKTLGVGRTPHLSEAGGESVAGIEIGGGRRGLRGAGLQQDADLEQFVQRVAVDVED